MTNQEMLAMLKGDDLQKLALFDSMIAQMSMGVALDDAQTPIFETLKKMLLKKPSIVVDMSASLQGDSGMEA